MTTEQILTDLMTICSAECVSLDKIIEDNQNEVIPPDFKFIPLPALIGFVMDARKTEKEERDKEKRKKPIKKFLFVEDGSVDYGGLTEELSIKNPEIKVVAYRQGACPPQLKEVVE